MSPFSINITSFLTGFTNLQQSQLIASTRKSSAYANNEAGVDSLCYSTDAQANPSPSKGIARDPFCQFHQKNGVNFFDKKLNGCITWIKLEAFNPKN